MPCPTSSPFTPAEFRALIRWKGWSHKELAAYWDISPVHVSRIVNDSARALHWNDAVMGLPQRGRVLSDLTARRARAAALVEPGDVPRPGVRRGRPPLAAIAARGEDREDAESVPAGAGTGYRYRGYVGVGSILALENDLSDSLREGDRGIVFAVVDTGVGERYGVIFESGDFDWFLPAHLDAGLVQTGLDAQGVAGYVFESDAGLRRDFDQGRFVFW
jgi:hypothetical protein